MTNISEKTTGSCKDREYIVTEVCPHCEAEVEMRWNVAADGYKAFCPHCGKRLMLCDACQHPEDKCVENCDYNSETDTCRHNQPAQELKAGAMALERRMLPVPRSKSSSCCLVLRLQP